LTVGRKRALRSIAGVLLLAWLAGCMGRGLVTQEYVLTAMTANPGDGSDPPATRDVVVGVGPVELPAYLRRPQIMTREARNELRSSEANRWAGELESDVARVVAQNLVLLIPSHSVSTFPWMNPTALDYRVSLRIDRFERGPDGNVALEAGWMLVAGRGAQILTARRSDIRQPTADRGYSAAVNAMSDALAELSREIAIAVRQQAERAAHR
jgi:uncharacterized lipoprotein YmbA